MGEHVGWSEPVGQMLNGLLPGAGPEIRALDAERWHRAEERTGELIACIQPNPLSEERRNAVANYVQQLIMKCFPCQVCTFGSVPLKTYLPDGDIDLTAFSHDQNLKDIWANKVRDMLESEEKNENAEFHVKEVQYIQAEVKLIKCLVENIVVDISFNQVGGLCTLCFLDEVNHLIGQNHLFKRSIILIKAWCYYESRVLGATHGLISTYALEILVLYIFHVFNNSFHGPLEVLYRFLEFFSNFDWDRFCVSLRGPVPINSLPIMSAETPRIDSGDLLFSKSFLDACSSAYAVFPSGQENNGQCFVSKHFNVIDPLRVNNNLGRSVSKGNFYRIRSAFAFGAKRLARVLDCPKDNLVFELNQFFMNTWERHGSGRRPDAVGNSFPTRMNTSDTMDSGNSNHESSRKKINVSSSSNVMVDGGTKRHGVSSQYGDISSSTIPKSDEASISHLQSLNSQNRENFQRTGKISRDSPDHVLQNNEAQKESKLDRLMNDSRGRFPLARTHSSPELTDGYADVSSQSWRYGKLGTANSLGPALPDASNRKTRPGSVGLAKHIHHSSAKDTLSVGNASFPKGLEGVSTESNSSVNTCHWDSGSDALNQNLPSIAGAHLDQEEQDVLPSAPLEGFNGQLYVPFGLSSSNVPFSIPPAFLASLGFTQRNLTGFLPRNSNIPLVDPSFSNLQYAHGFVSPSHYFPGLGVSAPCEPSFAQTNENFSSGDVKTVDADDGLWKGKGVLPSSDYESENRNSGVLVSEHKPHALDPGLKYIPPHRQTGSISSMKVLKKHTRERIGPMGQSSDNLTNQEDASSDLYADERSVSSRFSSASRSNSLRSRTSSEGSWDGSSLRTPRSAKEKRQKKTASADQGPVRGKGKMMSDRLPYHAEADEEGWMPSHDMSGTVEMNSRPENVASLKALRNHMSTLDISQTSGMDSKIPFAPMLVGASSRQNANDSSGLFPFYSAGPPFPFFTMLPLYNIPESDSSNSQSGHLAGDENSDANESSHDFSPERISELQATSNSGFLRGRTTSKNFESRKTDILNSDLASHLQNLQIGRSCQNPQLQGSYSSPVVGPTNYLLARHPYENSHRPLSAKMRLTSQIMAGYGHQLVPLAPLQPMPSSSRSPNMFQPYIDDIPRYRSGTGTYLPNPVAVRERHSSGGRRGNYRDDRNDFYGDRGSNWNANSRSRGGVRSHNRSQTDKYLKTERLDSNNSGTDYSSNSNRLESDPPYPFQNGPLSTNSSQNGPQNLTYSTHPFAAMNPNAHSNGHVSPLVMLYPFGNNGAYFGEQLEFGSLGPADFSGEHLQISEESRAGTFDGLENSGQWSSPDQPSSPHYQ